jgi:GAF domain-containing protein
VAQARKRKASKRHSPATLRIQALRKAIQKERNETKAALERLAASAEILKVISGSPTDLAPVLETIVTSSKRLLGGHSAVLVRLIDGELRLAAYTPVSPAADAELKRYYPRALDDGNAAVSIVVRERAPFSSNDIQNDPRMSAAARKVARSRGYGSNVIVPLLHKGNAVGAVIVSRASRGSFSEKEIALLQTFADQAVIALQNARMFNDTKNALARQTATADILRVIGSSVTDVQPVFDAIVKNCNDLFPGAGVILRLVSGDQLVVKAHVAYDAGVMPIDRTSASGACVLEGRTIHLPDLDEAAKEFPRIRQLGLKYGYRSGVNAPLMRGGTAIGGISVLRPEHGAFDEREVQLLTTFADQAVIAIENVRMFNETKEALEKQTATAEILRVLSANPADTQPVFEAIVRHAARLCDSVYANVFRFDGERLHWAASEGVTAPVLEALKASYPMAPNRSRVVGRVILDKRVVRVEDTAQDAEYDRAFADVSSHRRILGVPLMRGADPVGAITIGWAEPGPILDRHEDLLKTFADQAVIAIENVRLFNETKEALEHQKASAEILRIVASSVDTTDPVFEAITSVGARLLPGSHVALVLVRDGELHYASYTGITEERRTQFAKHFPLPLDRTTVVGTAIVEKRINHVADIAKEYERYTRSQTTSRAAGWRAVLAVPLLQDGVAIGVLGITRPEPGGFTERQVALAQTFADQAVIAIRNAKLFREIQERNTELKDALEQQTATTDILKVISRTTFDLQPVLEIVLSNARRICEADRASIFRPDDAGHYVRVAFATPEGEPERLTREVFDRAPIKADRTSAAGRAIVEGVTVHIPDVLADPEYKRMDIATAGNYRSVLSVPMLRDGAPIGVLSLSRVGEARPFSAKQIELVTVFADQAVIAIENVRLFNEIQDKTRELEAANKHKSEFLASMSHELRTPLNAILGFNEMILGEIYGTVPADMKEPLADIQKSGKHLLRLINNVLDLAKIEAGRMELALGEYSVQDAVEGVRSTLRPLASEKGLELTAAVPADLPLAYGDAGRITQCLMNLAGNALKFTRQGRVDISARLRDGLLMYRVNDTGIGIAPDKIGTLFAEFKQTDPTIASEYGGTGLGLSISKKFVEMHGGRIWVESEVGKGSSFIFEVPLRRDRLAT